MTRTLVITNDFPPRRGGIESFVLSLCNGMPPEEVVVYTARMQGSEAIDSHLPYPVIRDRSRVLLPSPRVARRVQQVAREHDGDRVLFGAAAPLGLLARGLRRHASVRHVIALTHGHEVWWARLPVTRHLLRRIGDDADIVTYVSEYCRAEIARALSPQAVGRMQPLSPAIDRTRFKPGLDGSRWRSRLGFQPEQPVALSASRLVRRKGQDVLIDAWPGVVAQLPEAVLVIAGDGPQRHRLSRQVRRRHLQHSIRFVPSVAWAEMPSLYAMADVFVLPCRTRLWGLEVEAFGIVFAEAAACGLPVIAGDSGGVAEAVAAGESCLVRGGDTAAIERQLLRLLSRARAADASPPS